MKSGMLDIQIIQPTALKKARTNLVTVLAAGLFIFLASASARAFELPTCTDCTCVADAHEITRRGSAEVNWDVDDQHKFTRDLITENINDQHEWFLNRWRTLFLPKLMLMAEHFTGLGMYQALIINSFFDGKQELEHQRTLNELTAEASHDYQPNVGMCIIGTGIRSLAAAERRGEYTRYVLSQRSQDRQMGHRNAQGSDGMQYDLRARMALFKTRYCDVQHNSGQLLTVCGASAPLATRSADINYGDLVDRPQTIDVDYADAGPPSDAERDIFALADNLYASNLMIRPPEAGFTVQQNREVLMDIRSLIAKRSVAENSFYSIIGMKSLGSLVTRDGGTPEQPYTNSTESSQYLRILLRQLGIANDLDIDKLVGKAPSYFAQMNILTKLIYQRPEFYTDLYDTKANVERKSTALAAIKLMQNFDRWDSMLRQEGMLSVWLELDLQKYQGKIENSVARLKTSGPEVKR